MIYKVVRRTKVQDRYRSLHEMTIPCTDCRHRARPLSYDMDKLTITVHSCGIGIFHFHYLAEAVERMARATNEDIRRGLPGDDLVIVAGDSDCQDCYDNRGAQWFVPRELHDPADWR